MTTLPLLRPGFFPTLSRNTTIVLTVLALHGAVLWAMQSGLLQRVAEIVVPAEMLVEIMAPAPPAPAPLPTPQPKAPTKPQTKALTPSTHIAPSPVATAQPAPSPLALAPNATAPAPSAAAPTAVATTNNSLSAQGNSNAPAAPLAPPAPPKLELPSSDADHLNNARPAYPAASKRLRQTGLVVVRVFIDADGQASRASIKQSSGFEELDQGTVEIVLKRRYAPGKRDGVPQGMWYDVPIDWNLKR